MKPLLTKSLFGAILILLSVNFAKGSCTASFTKSVSGSIVSFHNTSTTTSAYLLYHWDFGDGTFSSAKDPVKTYSTPGVKSISLTINDSLGCTQTITDTVLVGTSICKAHFTATINGMNVALTNYSINTNGSPTGLSYYWTFSDSTFSTAKDLVKTFSTIGYKTIQLTVSDSSQGCLSTMNDTILLPVTTSCAANFSKTINGTTVTFNNMSVNSNGNPAGLSYSWTFSDGTSSTVKNPVKSFTSLGAKWARLNIGDSVTGCFAASFDSFLLTSTACAARFTKRDSDLTVFLTNTSLNADGTSNGLSYLWNFSDGTSSVFEHPVKTFATTGTKTIQLTISDSSQGCSSTFTDTILLIPPPVFCEARFSLAIDTSAPFLFYILNTSIIQPASTFFWNFGDGATSTLKTPSHSYANFGVYHVCLTVSDTLCTSTYCDSIGMDSNGVLLKQGAFGFKTLDYTTLSTTTGLSETTHTPDYLLYPNPSAGDVFIDYTLLNNSSIIIKVMDMTGKEIMVQNLERQSGKHTENISLHELKPALYFISIHSQSGQKTYKLIKH